jgi:hypothetical protein
MLFAIAPGESKARSLLTFETCHETPPCKMYLAVYHTAKVTRNRRARRDSDCQHCHLQL